jgi:phage terminase small subunit
MKLTPKQENFCNAYIELGNASEAYRLAYDIGDMKSATINRAAKQLMDNSKITTRIQELRAPVVEAAKMSLEGHLADLKMMRDLALAEKQYSAAINAETQRGKAAGYYVTRTENKTELSGPDGAAISIELDEALTNIELRIRGEDD